MPSLWSSLTKPAARLKRPSSLVERLRRAPQEPLIVYALTPPERLGNVGDHAQVVAIHRWLRRHFPDHFVLELDKDLAQENLAFMSDRLDPARGDFVVLHSGGNLGDRGMWSERGRRNLIRTFQHVPIMSLPQTIFFSDTETGRAERENTRRIYAQHPNLTIVGRDRSSTDLARSLFPKAQVESAPDFVLSMDPVNLSHSDERLLLCLRNDSEGILSAADKDRLEQILGREALRFDTTFPRPIPVEQRFLDVEQTLQLFARHPAVVTDRFHGVIFSVLTGRPCVVLPTVDHKLTSAIEWFDEVAFVTLAQRIEDVPAALERVLKAERKIPDFNALHFEPLAQGLRKRLAVSQARRSSTR